MLELKNSAITGDKIIFVQERQDKHHNAEMCTLTSLPYAYHHKDVIAVEMLNQRHSTIRQMVVA